MRLKNNKGNAGLMFLFFISVSSIIIIYITVLDVENDEETCFDYVSSSGIVCDKINNYGDHANLVDCVNSGDIVRATNYEKVKVNCGE